MEYENERIFQTLCRFFLLKRKEKARKRKEKKERKKKKDLVGDLKITNRRYGILKQLCNSYPKEQFS